jgi:glycosidase
MNFKQLFILIGLFYIAGFYSCQTKVTRMEDHEAWQMFSLDAADADRPKIIIYQVFSRLFGNTNSNLRKNGSIQENGVGKFSDFSDLALQEINKLGISHIWYTGVIEHATTTDYSEYGIDPDFPEVIKGRAGSPYAIKDYYDVNPDLADSVPNRMQEFEDLIDRSHQNGLKVLIDFVPNHVARYYKSDAKPDSVQDFGAADDSTLAFSPANNFYYIPDSAFQVPEEYQSPVNSGKIYHEKPAKATGNNVFSATPSVNDWFETVKLNYGVSPSGEKSFDPVPDTWYKMKDILLFWADKGIDGFRCDMAEMVPVEFWQWVIGQVKEKYPDILFIAEIYNPAAYQEYLNQGRFNYLYDKVQLYDTLRSLVEGKGSVAGISQCWQALKGLNGKLLSFVENHDEQRIASPYFAGNPWKALPAVVVSAAYYTGPFMIYFGQEVGEPGAGDEGFSGSDGRTTIFDYWSVPEHQKWMNDGEFNGALLSPEQKKLRSIYSTLLNFCRSSEAISDGAFVDLNLWNRQNQVNIPDDVYVFARYHGHELVVVAVNFSGESRQVSELRLPEALLPVERSGFQELFTAENVPLSTNGRLKVELPPFGFKILLMKN